MAVPTGERRPPADEGLRPATLAMAAVGLGLGGAVPASPRRAARLFGFPAGQLNSTATAMARLYAIREAARGAQLLHEARSRDGVRGSTLALNLATDGFDTAMFAVLAVTRPDIRRATVPLTAFAGTFSLVWWRLLRRSRVRPGG